VLSPVTGLFCHRRLWEARLSQAWTPASGRQDHTTSPSARSGVRRIASVASTASRRNVSWRAQRPSCSSRTRKEGPLICPTAQAKFLRAKGWDRSTLLNRLSKIAGTRKRVSEPFWQPCGRPTPQAPGRCVNRGAIRPWTKRQ